MVAEVADRSPGRQQPLAFPILVMPAFFRFSSWAFGQESNQEAESGWFKNQGLWFSIGINCGTAGHTGSLDLSLSRDLNF